MTTKEKIVKLIMDNTQHGFMSACEEADKILNDYKQGVCAFMLYTDNSKTQVLEIELAPGIIQNEIVNQ